MPESDRRHIGTRKAEVAETLVGEACSRAMVICDAIEFLADQVDYRAREVAGEGISAAEKIELGAGAKVLAPFFEPLLAEGDDPKPEAA